MGFDDCYQLGNVVKTHGLRGEVVLFLDVDYPEIYQEMESVLIEINGKLVPFFIESLHLNGDRAITALEDIETIDDAKQLVGKNLFLPLRNLPDLPDGGYYFHQLIDFDFYDGEALIGKVRAVYEMPTNHLISVDHKGTEILVPAEDSIVKKVDLENKIIHADLPDGLIDIYLESEAT